MILKEYLELINPVLSLRWPQRFTSTLYQNLIQGSYNPGLPSDPFSIEFSEALNRLLEIKTVDGMNPVVNEIDFLLQNEVNLRILNKLRNQIWHKGVFYLLYHNFDLFVCEKILPLVKQITGLARYVSDSDWKYKSLSCGSDVINSLITEAQKTNPDYEKIALLKEMGRAAYCNPLTVIEKKVGWISKSLETHLNREKIDYAHAKSEAVRNTFFYTDVFKCPVCGQETLIKHEMIDWYDVEDENGKEYPESYYIPQKIKCEMCSFEVMPNIKDLTLCGISEPNFWDEHA